MTPDDPPSDSPPDFVVSPPEGPPARSAGRGILTRMDKGRVRHVVAIGSGKGGVGKSSVAVQLAAELRRRGHSVGILDADVTGPSIPKLLGMHGPLVDRGEGIEPASSRRGISVVSSQFMVEDEQTPVIWRGPLVTRLITQFFGSVNWGALDFLLIDMPPGTSDVPLTVFQTIPIDGMIFVLTPQDLAALIVRKAMNMARDLHVPLLGVVDNMSYLTCPHCGKRIDLFGPSRIDRVAAEYGVPVLAQLPVVPSVSTLGDEGRLDEHEGPELAHFADEFAKSIDEITKRSVRML